MPLSSKPDFWNISIHITATSFMLFFALFFQFQPVSEGLSPKSERIKILELIKSIFTCG